ncbi:peroxiredoxin [[Eubacterium] cellulosolvens]
MATIEVGKNAPNFILTDTDLKKVSLMDFEKKIVLAFYPGAFTSVCTKEMCAFRDSLAKLNELRAQVIGISVNDPFCNKAFSETNSLNFTILSDYAREVVNIYGVAAEDFAGLKGYTVAKRSIFIIDDKGIVRYKWITEDPAVEPNYDEIMSKLEKLK